MARSICLYKIFCNFAIGKKWRLFVIGLENIEMSKFLLPPIYQNNKNAELALSYNQIAAK